MGNCLDSTITHVLQDIGILQMSHIHLFRNSWQQGKTSFAGKYEKNLKCEVSVEYINEMRFR